MAQEFVSHYHEIEKLMTTCSDVTSGADPIESITSFFQSSNECSETATEAGDGHTKHNVYEFFLCKDLLLPGLGQEYYRAEDMNPLCGYEIVPELEEDFRAFVKARDAKLAEKASQKRKVSILDLMLELFYTCYHLPLIHVIVTWHGFDA